MSLAFNVTCTTYQTLPQLQPSVIEMEARHAQIDHHIRSFSGLGAGPEPQYRVGAVRHRDDVEGGTDAKILRRAVGSGHTRSFLE
jgi:hypothetical protein